MIHRSEPLIIQVRLVKLQKSAHGLRHTAPAFQHALFCCGTILALSAVEDGLSNPLDSTDAVRRAQATLDLRYIIDSLREVGITWPAANTSASVLEGKVSLRCFFVLKSINELFSL